MIALRKAFSFILGIFLIGATILLGIQSGKDSRFVVWFGLASAIAAPLGLAQLASIFNRWDSEIITRLAKVPEIEKLMNEARTQEEKIQLLEDERLRLADIVRFESRRQAILDRIDSLERDATRILDELAFLDREVVIFDENVGKSPASSEIRQLRERVKARNDGDVIIRLGARSYRIDRDIVKALPFGLGNSILAYFRIAESLGSRIFGRSTR
ncbi:hypothetical protein [Vulcanococcus limneticus]|uniref:hypothetical protein n=1 Tax=Vulcanococcus limneticus TaxID=2170428 RepID=UPI00398BC1FE